MNDPCQLCRLATGQPSDGFAALFGRDASAIEIIAKKDDLFVILDIAPVTIGHALLVTRDHERSFSPLWLRDSCRLNKLVDAVIMNLRRSTGLSAIICEHGLGPKAIGQAGCVEHAHIHIIPTNDTFVSSFRQAGVDLHDEARSPEQIFNCELDQQYLYLRDADGSIYTAVQPRFPSQLVRRLVAQHQGELFWSWRDYVDFAKEIGTRKRILEGRTIYERVVEAMDLS